MALGPEGLALESGEGAGCGVLAGCVFRVRAPWLCDRALPTSEQQLPGALNGHVVLPAPGWPMLAENASGEAFLGSFVASGMGPSASSHGSPVPLPSDLSFRSPTPNNLPMVQLWAAHAHEGFSHLPSGLYPSYLHLNHLEPPSSGSPLLSQLGQPSIFDTQKDASRRLSPALLDALDEARKARAAPGLLPVLAPPVGMQASGRGSLSGLGDSETRLRGTAVVKRHPHLPGRGHGRADDDCGDERARHREERLLGARLDRDQEKLLRESKELADLARLHPTSCAANGLNPNLMVTGGPSLAGSGRWSADPAAHLATPPWLPRSGSASMWLAGHPYGLGPPPLHQGMAPAFPPGLGGSLPSAYQFVRDPQSGQLVVIPSDHLPHFGAERGPVVRPSLESLLAASSHMLKEVLDSPFVDPLKNLRLPRELNPNKKYSWMQKKEERMYAMKSSLESMDAMELDFRMRLAEVQRRYKEKQRELVKLQRRRDSEDRREEPHRSLARRGPGRPRKRTHALSTLSPPRKRGKSRNSSGKLSSKPLLTSDEYELGAGMRKRHKGPEEEHDALVGTGKARGRNQPWDEHEASSDFMSQLKIKKKKMASDQEQLASKLDKALSLTKQDKLKSPFKFSDSSGGKSKASGGCGRYLTPYDSLLGKDRKALAKGLSLSLKASREGKHKRAAKARKMEVGFKARGQPKSAHSPFASEVSSYSYNTDSEEDEGFLKDEWSAQGPSSSKLTSSILCGMVAKNGKPAGGPKLSERGLAAARTLKPKPAAGRKQPFCLLLREVEARSSFSDSSEDSFDQDPSLSRPATMGNSQRGLVTLPAAGGTEFEYTDSESEVKVRKRSPAGLLRPKKGLGEPGPSLAAPAPSTRGPGPAGPDKAKLAVEKGRKARKLRGAKEPGFEAGPEASDDDLWTRRRSERIFLHDASAAAPAPSSAAPAATKPSRCGKGGPLSPRKDTGRAKDRKDPRKNRGKGGAVSKLMESMAAEEDFEPNQDSSFSEDEHLPRGGAAERPLTPAPRSCIIDKDELKDGLRVLIPMDDKLLYAGHVQTVHSPDIYRVVVEGERGNRPHIYCLEQLLQEAINDVRPASTRFLPQGTRIAAYWSQQYRCLYPGTVVRGLLGLEDDGDLITVEFDDGDTGRIPLSHIRLLPPDYKIQCAEPSPALLVPSAKRRSRKTSKDTGDGKDGGTPGSEEPGTKARGRGRKPSTKAKSDRAAVLEEGGPTEEVPSTPLALEPISTPGSKKSPPEPADKRAKAPKARPAAPQASPAPSTFTSCPAPEPFGELPAPAAVLAPTPLVAMPIAMPGPWWRRAGARVRG
ncbi:trinucleotide repeat-containing gene 18 protein [Puma concolor]|uniref:Trinucleotide repeat-containing gene 18 protein n=1 Tax=Puma concolor TaxID=9696 RepID=A0A6P6HUY1_PUMCO|nr:trinucleotide repeat-containing gene 18 protein [Puma concolor]